EVTRGTDVLGKLLNHYDLLIDTVSAPHDYNEYLRTLRPLGEMVIVGIPPKPTPVDAMALIIGNRRLVGSNIGGIEETQKTLDYCGAHNVVSDIELIPMKDVNTAYERIVRADVRYRFVIDMASLK